VSPAVQRVPPAVSRVITRAEPERRGIDPVVGKAIIEKSGFFFAAIVLSVLIEKAQHVIAA